MSTINGPSDKFDQPYAVDDREQFEKDLNDHVDQWGIHHSSFFSVGWKKCRDYKFKLFLKENEELKNHVEILRKELEYFISRVEGSHPDEEFFVSVIEKWQFTWMDVKGTNEKDRTNYYAKAHSIDANMRYSLARMLVKEIKEEKK